MLLKPYTIESRRIHGHKNTRPFRNLIASATDYLSSLSSFYNCDNNTMYYIMVDSEATSLMDVTGIP